MQTTVGSSGDAGAAFLGGTGSNQATFSVTFDKNADATVIQNHDLVNQRRRGGMSIDDVVFDGARLRLRLRLRPILMTAIATIFALIPMSLGLTVGGAVISQPLAVVVIGGLFSSTVLTLVLVPVLYTLIERARGWRGRRNHGRRHAGRHAAA